MIAPALFAIVWMSIIGGLAIHSDKASGGALKAALDENRAESVIYALFEFLPFAPALVVAFVLLPFVSFVTASDSNTEAIASLCEDRTADNTSPTSLSLKVIWGVMIDGVTWFMTASADIQGIKMMSNLGGIPALFIVLGAMFCLWRMIKAASTGKPVNADTVKPLEFRTSESKTAPAKT